MQKLIAGAVAGTIALLALIVGAITLASVCSFAADQIPEPERPSLPTRTAVQPIATAAPSITVTEAPAAPAALEPASPAPPLDTSTANFAGSWLVREYVIEGPGAGRLTTYEVHLVQSGDSLTGSGGGLSLQGRVQGQTADLDYRRSSDGSSGVFTWTLVRDDAAAGVLTSSAAAKGLVSMQRQP